jgi:hypothetical protein
MLVVFRPLISITSHSAGFTTHLHVVLGTCSGASMSGGVYGEYMHMKPLLIELGLSVPCLGSYCCGLAGCGKVHAC